MAILQVLTAIAAIHSPFVLAGQAHLRGIDPSKEIARDRAPEIFNAVHDSMRQWGSSLHHNGMSYFLATVPEGALFYHGNRAPESPVEPDWLAFEIEHAEQFARVRPGPGPGDGPGPGPGPQHHNGPGGFGFGRPPPPPPNDVHFPSSQEKDQKFLQHGKPQSPPPQEAMEEERGYLHVYRTTRQLPFLYVDGMSAGKTSMGTLDSQDYLLRGVDSETEKKPEKHNPGKSGRPRKGPMGEAERAKELCELATSWGLQGIIRMETGFEIIKCDFKDGLEEIQTLQRPGPRQDGPGNGMPGGPMGFEFLRGVSERYDGIGSSRTKLDYASMVSAYFFPVNLTNPDSSRPDLPRLTNLSGGELAEIKRVLGEVVKQRAGESPRAIDWQDVTDIIASRYSDRIEYMAMPETSTKSVLETIDFVLDTFIDYSGKESDIGDSAAIGRCANLYLGAIRHVTEADKLIHAAFRTITGEICSTLFKIREVGLKNAENEELIRASASASLSTLKGYLNWARFKKCTGCGVDQICFIPMWPTGTTEDYENPHCGTGSGQGQGKSYWGHFGPPGGPPGGGPPGGPPGGPFGGPSSGPPPGESEMEL